MYKCIQIANDLIMRVLGYTETNKSWGVPCMFQQLTGRFAPSPTGLMHLGNARSALLAWLQMRALGGRMLLRIEDLDKGRCRDFAYDALRQDLSWLGLSWDAEYIQSERLELYAQALAQLSTYTCSCSRKDIREAASAPHEPTVGEALPPVYPGTCRSGPSHPERPLAIRWCCSPSTVCVRDLRLGELCQQLATEVGDLVLRRNDGVYAYHLAVVVDDGLMGVTHVTRGEDLWAATPAQVALQQALGYRRPVYLHLPLMRDFRGQRLAKRQGAPPLAALREAGESPEKVLAELAQSLGWHVPEQVSADELLQVFGHQVVMGLI